MEVEKGRHLSSSELSAVGAGPILEAVYFYGLTIGNIFQAGHWRGHIVHEISL